MVLYLKKILIQAVTLLASASSYDLKYTIESFAIVDGDYKHCINDCINDKCIVDATFAEYNCTSGTKIAPKAFTYQNRQSQLECLSRCDFIKTDYSWCYVKSDRTWDYCNANEDVVWMRNVSYTLANGPCKSECRKTCENSKCRFTCEHYWGSTDECEPEYGYDYLQSHSMDNQLCRGSCFTHEGYSYYWCVYGHRVKDRCAYPMLNRTSWKTDMDLLRHFTEIVQFKVPIASSLYFPNGIKPPFDDETLASLATQVNNDPGLNVVHIRDHDKQSITSHVEISLQKGYSEINRPVLIRAEIFPKHLRDNCPPAECSSNSFASELEDVEKQATDSIELLVPYSLGGTKSKHNLGVVYRRLAVGHFAEEERTIRKFFNDNQTGTPKVNLDIYMMYDDQALGRPYVFLTHVKYFLNSDLVKEYYAVLPNF